VSRGIGWLLGLALLGGVVAMGARLSEAGAFLRVVRDARGTELLLAVALQAATYLVHGQVWRGLAAAAGARLPWGTAAQVSLAKLFVDQVLPSGGIAGTLLAARGLEALGLARPVVMAAVVVNTASHYAAYVLSVLAALVVAAGRHQGHPLLVGLAIVFSAFGATVVVAVLVLAGPRAGRVACHGIARTRLLARALAYLEAADAQLARRPSILVAATVYQLGVVLLDAATVWVLVSALGATTDPRGVFAAFMISSLVRTMGVLPAGLGTFEATSVVTLHLMGVEIPIALSATLLFRGLSLWLPLPLGAWCARRLTAVRRASPS